MARPSSDLADQLGRRLRTLNLTRSQIEKLAVSGSVSRHAALRMYEALFLSAHVALEGFLDELFFGLLVSGGGVESRRRDIAARITVSSHRVAREIITDPSRPYIDWFPYDRTVALANRFFRGGRPFTDLTANQKDTLAHCHIIRNVIAHKSRYSVEKFEKRIIGGRPLPASERNPAGYLRGSFRVRPAQTRFENMLSQMLLIARDLAR